MLEFYWSLGRDIVNMKSEQRYGSGFFNQLSLDLKAEFPNTTGFSVTNLRSMRLWYNFYYQRIVIRHQAGAEFGINVKENHQQAADDLTMPLKFGLIPWFHHVKIITKCESLAEAMFYVHKTIEGNWSRSHLESEIKDNLYSKQGHSINNFDRLLPAKEANAAKAILKSSYTFDFLSLGKENGPSTE